MNTETLRIDPARLQADFDALAEIGATGDGGVHRPSLSPAHLAAREWLREQITRAGLEMRVDGAGNHSAFLACAAPGAPTLLLGSHLDSVPYGGRFDGPLGVLSALEALRVVKEAGLFLSTNLEAIDFTDEEGTLVGFLGSAALAGHFDPAVLEQPRGGRDAVQAAMARAGLTVTSLTKARRAPESLAGYVELHIEQGTRLVKAGRSIGIVSDIVGISSYRLTFGGRADHAGTTTMQDRRDAGQGASAFNLAAREIVLQGFPHGVVNIGHMVFAPGAFNIVPASVVVSLEFRAAGAAELDGMDAALLNTAEEQAARFGLELKAEFLGRHAPTPMSLRVQAAIESACDSLRLSHMPLVSGAGHDGQSLAGACPTGMLFVPSVGGASHSPREFTEWQDCINGANVLLQAALRLAR